MERCSLYRPRFFGGSSHALINAMVSSIDHSRSEIPTTIAGMIKFQRESPSKLRVRIISNARIVLCTKGGPVTPLSGRRASSKNGRLASADQPFRCLLKNATASAHSSVAGPSR